jgi:hypothetical protein
VKDGQPNFKEEDTVDGANLVDLETYRFVKLDERRGYVFARRQRRA